MKVSAYILADHREDTGAVPYLSQMISSNNRVNSKLPFKSGGGELISQVVNNATIGDYAILLPSLKDSSKNIIAAVFERKTWKDLAASLKDQRAVTQHKNMIQLQEKKGCLLYYIIEGGLTYQDGTMIARIPFKNLHAKMRSMSLKGVHSFQTKDQQDTARLLINLARDMSRLYRTGSIDFSQQEQQITPVNPVSGLNKDLLGALAGYQKTADANDPILQALQQMIEMTSKTGSFESADLEHVSEDLEIGKSADVPTELTTRPVHRNDDIIMNMWCSLPCVSSKSAPVLMKEIPLYDVLTAAETDITDLTNRITDFCYITGIKFGSKRAEKIMQVAYHGDNKNQLSIQQDLSARVLSQVPGITKEVAQLILSKFTLADVVKGTHAEEISNIKRNNRRIGKKIINRIAGIFHDPDPCRTDVKK